jgi:hypothetical protein
VQLVARMVPERIDEATASPAERLMFRELNTQLGEDYLVLHSVRWVANRGGRHQDGEADFIVAHPDQGVLVIEVKGGTIRRDGPTDSWYTKSWNGSEEQLKLSPFVQVERTMRALAEKLQTTHATMGFTYPLARTVAFPDVLVTDEMLGVDIQRSMIIDSSNVFLMAKTIRAAMAQSPGPGPGPAGVSALLDLVRPSFVLNQRGLAARIKDDEATMLKLTEQQLYVLDMLAGHRQLAIRGIAGAGKTVLAREHAVRQARSGLRVLFTCYNKALAAEMGHELAGIGEDEGGCIHVRTYHDLAEELARRAGIAVDGDPEIDSAAYYEQALPEAMAQAIGVLDDRYDAIVVDEGQDFADLWWVTLEALQADPGSPRLAIFYDDNQRIYRRDSVYPIPEPHLSLTRNCRTTQAIHELAAQYIDGYGQCIGPDGTPVEFVPVGSQGPLDAVRRTVHRLTADEGIPLDQIVVLTPRSVKRSELTNGTKLGNLTLAWDGDGRHSIRCRNIHAFKGLEATIVILAEAEHAHPQTRDRLLHVALSRARHHLVVIGQLPERATNS